MNETSKLTKMIESRVLKIASEEICQEDEVPVYTQIVGLRFDAVQIRLTLHDYLDSFVQQWLKFQIFTRAKNIYTFGINIEVVPPKRR